MKTNSGEGNQERALTEIARVKSGFNPDHEDAVMGKRKKPMNSDANRLLAFIAECKKDIARQAATRERQRAQSENRVKAQILRDRFEEVLTGMEAWVAQGKFESWFKSMDPHAIASAEKGVPLSRFMRRATILESVFLERLGQHHDGANERFARHVEIANQFFARFTQAFAISYEKHQDRLLREAHFRHDSFFHNMIFPAFLADAAGRLQAANPAMCEFMRIEAAQLMGRSIRHVLCDDRASSQLVEKFWVTLKRKKWVDRFALSLVCPERGPLHIEISAKMRRNIDGEIVGIQGFLQDVTRRVKSERLVEEQFQTLEAIFEHAPIGLLFIDSRHIIRMVNKTFQRNVGLDPEARNSGIGKNNDDHVLELAAQSYREPEKYIAFVRKMHADKKLMGEREFHLRNDRVIVLQSAPVLSKNGQYLGRIALNRDLTHERELEQLRENLTQMIVHDLKNPLAAITLSAILLRDLLPEIKSDKHHKPLEIISRNSDTMMRMIMNLLDISRMEENKLDLKHEPTNIFDLIDELRSTLGALAGGRTVVLPRRRKMPDIDLDPNLIRRVIENVFGNAVKHTRPDGRVALGVRRTGERWLHISISDNGEGIAKEDQAHVFEKFAQAAGRRRGRKTDTGLGLTFCKMAVEAHGGSIGLASERGKGSTFAIRLPFNC